MILFIPHPNSGTMTSWTCADIFSGIGGFRLALERAGFDCLYSCEINSACRKVYQENFGEEPYVDISEVNFSKLPDVQLVTAGFPCQPFSICGKRQGFSDKRGTIFFYICELIRKKRPDVVILENVKHLLHLDKGASFRVILNALKSLNYFVEYKVLNAKNFGLPQNRERLFIVASKHKPFDFNQVKITFPTPKLIDFLDEEGEFEYLDPSEYTLIDNPKQQESGLIFVGYRNKSIWKTGVRPNTEHLSRVHRQPNRIYSVNGVHPTLPSQESSGRFFIYLPNQHKVRKLTVNECYRIMGFPEEFRRTKNLGDAYKQIGNSVATTVISELLKAVINQNLFQASSTPYIFKHRVKDSTPVQLTIPGLW
jgi:DNA (cytosine-5)-methyltransferase 1